MSMPEDLRSAAAYLRELADSVFSDHKRRWGDLDDYTEDYIADLRRCSIACDAAAARFEEKPQ